MSILDELRAGRIQKEQLNDVQAAEARQLLLDEQDVKIKTEQAASEKTHRSAVRQQGLNETVGPQPQRPIRSAETGAFSGPVTDIDPEARATVAAQRAGDVQRVEGLDRNATPQFKPITAEAGAEAAASRARGPAPATPTSGRATVGGTGYTGSQLDDVASKPGIIERGLRAVGATGAADTREAARIGAREADILEPATARAAGGELDVEERPMSNAQQKKVDSLQSNIDTADERKRRAQRTINTSKNPADVAAAKEAITAANKDIQGATTRQATVRAEARTPTPVTDAVERAKKTVKQPAAVGDDVVNKATAALDDTISKVDDATKKGLEKGKGIFNRAIDKGKAAFAGLKGGGTAAASASVDAGVDELTKDMPEGPQKRSAVRALGTLGKVAGVVGLVDMAGSYLRNVYETDFRTANIDLIEGIQELVTSGLDTAEAVRAGEVGMDEVAVELARGVYDGIVGIIPSIVDNGQFFAGEAFDAALGLSTDETTEPTGLREIGPAPGTTADPAFAGARDPGELPGVPGERFDPLGTQPSVAPVTQEPFLEQGTQEGQFDIRGLDRGTGTIDATGATGGPSGFAQRVEESRRAGAYEPVSQERRDEATRDLDRVRKGTAAFRDLAATRLGVPTQYLDAVRSGAMTPREANLAQAKQAAAGHTGVTSPRDLQAMQIAAAGESRAQAEFNQKMDTNSIERFNNTATEVADSFPRMSEEEKAEVGSGFTSFAAGWVPEGVDPKNLSQNDMQTIKGQYILATSLAKYGEGWFRSLLPWKADITADTLFTKGENILESMERQGEWFDIGNDNLRFQGRDSAGDPVTLTIEPEELPPIAQQMINQARANLDIQPQGLQR
jgi:hypothetical protein